jgi:3-hydroxyisobutyrate dehydrogenase-like beta-hydroxyacid dehydrogenase
MVGGDEATFERCRPVLESIGDALLLGPLGSGQTAKLINNFLLTANVGLAQDALTLGGQLGLDVGKLAETLAQGNAKSGGLDYYVRRRTGINHSVLLLRKDCDLAEGLLRQAGLQSLAVEPAAEQALVWLAEAGAAEARESAGSGP